jgi:hypothetical protein
VSRFLFELIKRIEREITIEGDFGHFGQSVDVSRQCDILSECNVKRGVRAQRAYVLVVVIVFVVVE